VVEYLLLLLLSSASPESFPIGYLPLNITSSTPLLAELVNQTLETIYPLIKRLPLTIDAMNSDHLFLKKVWFCSLIDLIMKTCIGL